MLIGIAGAILIRLIVYTKGKNAKKYRKGMEYGSARWGNAEDIKPYIDPIFENKRAADADRTADDVKPPEAPEICTKQKCTCNRRLRQRQNEVFCKAKLNANAQQLCSH